MNIWNQAKEMPNADYYDFHTGNIYHIKEYTENKKSGLPTYGIRVSCDGKTIGYVEEE